MTFKRCRIRITLFPLVGLFQISLILISSSTANGSDSEAEFFRNKIEPILSQRCLACHGEDAKGGLDLRTAASFEKGGKHGPVVVSGKPTESRLFRLIAKAKMPPEMPLVEAETEAIRKWIERGAVFPDRKLNAPQSHGSHRVGLDWWSLQPIANPAVPSLKSERAQNPIDLFLLDRLQKERLSFSAPADRATYCRRVYLTLTGLAPTYSEIQNYLADTTPHAKERLVERLLESPPYGEHWARHWLDVARFAESDGFERDRIRPNAWRYRDYVIDAFQRNLPFDQFVQEQLAGDAKDPEDPRCIAATGFLAAGPRNDVTTASPLEKLRTRQDELDDFASVTGSTFLGLTIGCARCHDHKYDPITTKDYYSLTAVFSGLQRGDRTVGDHNQKNNFEQVGKKQQQRIDAADAIIKATFATARKRIAVAGKQKDVLNDDQLVEHLNSEEQLAFQNAVTERARAISERARLPKLPTAFAILDGKASDTFVLRLGDVRERGELAPPISLSALPAVRASFSESKSETGANRRVKLAQWLTNRDNPLTARVFVNRVWQYQFGAGLVATSSDFGSQGERPSHPELLDWLARDFIDHGWNIKRLQKMIVLSAAFGQSSNWVEPTWSKDPANRLLWRFAPARMDAETVRDSVLKLCGQWNPQMGGPSVALFAYRDGHVPEYVPLEELGKETFRRSIYLFNIRTYRDPLLAAYDCPEPTVPAPTRSRTTTVQQALTLLNSRFIFNQCSHLADQIRIDGAFGPDAQVAAAFRQILSRDPTKKERSETLPFLAAHGLPALLRVLLNTNEFLTIH